jgi:hypothetical protein
VKRLDAETGFGGFVDRQRVDLSRKNLFDALIAQRVAELGVPHLNAMLKLLHCQPLEQPPLIRSEGVLGNARNPAKHMIELVGMNARAGFRNEVADAAGALQAHAFREKGAESTLREFACPHSNGAVLILMAIAQSG